MGRLTPALRDAALRWMADDPDPETRAELQQVLAAAMAGSTAAADDVAARMAGSLHFGTAGLRGPVRAGPAGMNVAVVRRATAGVASWLALCGHAGGTVVLGRDARHGSAEFCSAAAEVLAGAGFDTRVLPAPLPTPVLAYAVRQLAAVAGVQITASHNPPADNGYKLYLADGAQLNAPADTEVEAAIEAAPPAISVPTADSWSTLGAATVESYLDRIGTVPRGTAKDITIALTPLHGVGGETAVLALRRAGFTTVHVVPTQAAPDPDFPTVSFPNPEEPGATDALLTLAAEIGADLAVALDPDADRCALGVPLPAGGWRMLTGDETGALLGERVLGTTTATDPLVATTVVSSSLLGKIAAARGARYAETLTGFKNITRAGAGLIYGYEEALGYCVDPDAVRDKDGMSAAVLAADLVATLKAGGRTLLDMLDELAVEHGVHLTEGLPVRMEPDQRAAVLDRLQRTLRPERPAPDVLVLRGAGQRIVVRPSGTEPKLKVYLEVVQPVGAPAALPSARARATEHLARLRTEVTQLLTEHPDEAH